MNFWQKPISCLLTYRSVTRGGKFRPRRITMMAPHGCGGRRKVPTRSQVRLWGRQTFFFPWDPSKHVTPLRSSGSFVLTKQSFTYLGVANLRWRRGLLRSGLTDCVDSRPETAFFTLQAPSYLHYCFSFQSFHQASKKWTFETDQICTAQAQVQNCVSERDRVCDCWAVVTRKRNQRTGVLLRNNSSVDSNR